MAFDTGIFIDTDDSTSIPDPRVLAAAAAIDLPINLGRFWEDCVIDIDPSSNRKFDIYSRTETQRAGTVGTGGWDDSATTALPVTSSLGLVKGLVLKVADEYVVVDDITSATVITVRARGAAGTTAAAHIATVAYTVVGSAIDDVDLKDVTSIHESTTDYTNYMQTVAETIDYTRGGLIDPRMGLSNSMVATLQQEAMFRVARNIYAAAINGKKAAKSSTSPWLTAGLLQQLSDTTDSRVVLTDAVGGAFTETALKAALRTVTDVGTPTDIYMSSQNKDIANTFVGSATSTTLAMNTDIRNTIAGYHVNQYNYEGLILNIKMDSGLPNDQISIVNNAKCKKGWKKGDALALEKQPTLSTREMRDAYNGSFYLAIEDVGQEHILMTGIDNS